MPAFSIEFSDGRSAFVQSVEEVVAAVRGVDERELLGASRCHGWARLDVVTHLLSGWQELGLGFLASTGHPPTVDAATYWQAFAEDNSATDPVRLLMAQRRRTDSYTRPETAVAHMVDIANGITGAAGQLHDGCIRFQGHVLTTGDLLASWAVENAIHHLDLLVPEPPATPALELARRTCDALLPGPLPEVWPDDEAVLVATGRAQRPDVPSALAPLLPVI